MLGKWALLLAICSLSNAINFPDDLYPKELSKAEYKHQCPNEYHQLSLCIPKYEDCFGRMVEIKECNKEFQKCTEITLEGPIGDDFELDDCSNYTTNAVFYVWTHGTSIQKEVVKNKRASCVESIRKGLEPMGEAFRRVQKECMIEGRLRNEMHRLRKHYNFSNELMEVVLPYLTLHLVEPLIAKTKRCRSASQHLEKVMETTDMKPADNLHLPYEFWHMGSDFGPIGKVPFRVIADDACGKATLDMNHHSVIHVNCYDQQSPRSECDQRYIDGIEAVLSTMDSTKVNCKMYTDLIKTFLPLRAAQFYKEAGQFVSNSKMLRVGEKFNRGFSGFVNGSMTRRDTKNTFIKLEVSASTPLRLLDYYNHVSSECGASRKSAGIVSSCGFLYEHCTHFVQSGCFQKLSICLNTIDNMTDSCQTAVSRLDHFLWPVVEQSHPAPVSKKRVDKWTIPTWLIIALAVAVGLAIVCALVMLWLWVCGVPSKRKGCDQPPEESELINNNQIESQVENLADRIIPSAEDLNINNEQHELRGVNDHNEDPDNSHA